MTPRRQQLAAASGAAFAVLTVAVWAKAPVVGVDDWVWRLSLRLRVDALVSVARLVTLVFSPPVTSVALAAVAVVVSRRRRSTRPLVAAVLTGLSMAVLTRGLKLLLARPGPGSDDVGQLNGAYPSGHTASLIVCGGAIVLLLGWARRRVAWTVLAGVSLLVMTSLIYAHQHWLSDVVGSLLLASALLLCFSRRLTQAGQVDRVTAPGVARPGDLDRQGASWSHG